MADGSEKNAKFGETGVIELTGKIMVVAIVLLFFVVIFVFCLHLYAKWFWYRRHDNNSNSTTGTRRRRRLDFAAGHHEIPVVSALRHGLDPSVLKTLPVTVFDPKESKDGLECAVCLCEVSEGEKTRLLPKCNHGFHVDCIDMWFQSHSTCPLCRNPVSNGDDSSPLEASSTEGNTNTGVGGNFPTNVLIWGDETRVSTFGDQGNVAAETSSSSLMASSSGRPDEEEDQKSQAPTRLRSLKRLLSGNRRVNPSRNLDIEEGGRGGS